MQDAIAIRLIETKYRWLVPLMDERMRRQWAASEAGAYGWGGVAAVAHATGLSPTTIRKGQAELALRSGQRGCSGPARDENLRPKKIQNWCRLWRSALIR